MVFILNEHIFQEEFTTKCSSLKNHTYTHTFKKPTKKDHN